MEYFDQRDELDCVEDLDLIEDFSPIRDFYADKTVLITGATGFFGKVLLEKLLRTCDKVKKIYLLMRPKRGKTPVERMKEQFDDTLFAKMKDQTPNFLTKVELVEGDCIKSRIGLSDSDLEKLLREVEIIFHAGAALRLDEHLRDAYNTNVAATKYLLEMARKMPNFKAMIHFSTAYSHAYRNRIGEEFYPVSFSFEEIERIFESLDDRQIGAITPQLVGKWLNTYAFTKALAETVVQKYVEEYSLPVAIARPSIVVSTNKDPVRSWINNIYGATGVLTGAGLGLLHTFYCDKHKKADLIPVDYVIHASIAAAWETANEWCNRKTFPVYNMVSTHYCKDLTWGKFMDLNEQVLVIWDIQTLRAIWPYTFRLESRKLVYDIENIQMHVIPAILFDIILRSTGKPPMLLKNFRKINNFVGAFFPYCTRDWDYESDNVTELCAKLTSKEQQLFQFDIKKINWSEYFSYFPRGIRLYVLKDDFSTLKASQKRTARLRIIHKVLLASIYAFRACVAYYTFRCVFRAVSNYVQIHFG